MSEELRVTERVNVATRDLDRMTPLEVVRVINQEDRAVAEAVGRCDAEIARAVEAIVTSFARGGRLIYIGAGTSGRLGVLDASECPPTFSTPPSQVLGIIAGGEQALRNPIEGAEDDAGAGAAAVREVGVRKDDTVCGITASGRTPYVKGALDHARSVGAFTVLVTCNPQGELRGDADCVIAPVSGPEVVAGSTRLKAGTATKMILNTLTTASLALSGKVYSNLMVDVRPSNEKLVKRAKWLIAHVTGVDEARAAELLEASGRNVKVAIVMEKRRVGREEAVRLLESHGGFLRRALGEER
jgi:N-acetylmuramic acid 6-phosphate etherase